MSSKPQKPQLFALLVAINEYIPPITPLHGCVNDLEKVATYLQKESSHFDIQVKQLMNKEATKAAIVEQFETHLGQAAEGDVAFFYYSGHGTQEEADPVFWPVEEDRQLESLVCFDSFTQDDGQVSMRLLADKELRYLIHKIARNHAHIVTVFDCCHSGGNTRNAYIAEEAEAAIEKRWINRERLSQAFPSRNWEDFIFSDTIPYKDAQHQPISEWLPEGKHIQMAACQHDQSAFEVKGEGVFTKNLLEVLNRSEGAVTYYDLQSRIQNYLRHQFDQHPKIYAQGEDESGLFQGFLSKEKAHKPLYGNVSYNLDLGWIIDLGAMHGISTQFPKLRVTTLDEQHTFRAKLEEVYPAYALISFDETAEDEPDTKVSYKGFVDDYFSCPIGIFLNIPDDAIRNSLQEKLSKFSDMHCTDTAHAADYCVQYAEQHLYITLPGNPTTPLIRPQKYTSENDLVIIKNYLTHLSQFAFVKNLQNPNTFLFSKLPVKLSIFEQGAGQKDTPVPLSNDEVLLDYAYQNPEKENKSIRIKVKNISDRKLYCALLYLSFNFEVNVKLLKEVVGGLEPNQEVWALDGAPIGLTLEDEITTYNYPESITYLKLIVSTSDFKQQASRFALSPLPAPTTEVAQGTRGLDVNAYHPGSIEDWITHLYTIKIRNPWYKPPTSDIAH